MEDRRREGRSESWGIGEQKREEGLAAGKIEGEGVTYSRWCEVSA